MHALEVKLAPQVCRHFAGLRSGKRGPPFRLGERSIDLPKVVRFALAWPRDKVRQLAEENIELQCAAFAGNGIDLCLPRRIGMVAEQPRGDLRVSVGDDHAGVNLLAAREFNAFAGNDPLHGNTGRDHSSGLAGRVAKVKAHHAHAAAHVAPHSGHTAKTP